jgi:branched-chain amino acid transport system substrate-binding protein
MKEHRVSVRTVGIIAAVSLVGVTIAGCSSSSAKSSNASSSSNAAGTSSTSPALHGAYHLMALGPISSPGTQYTQAYPEIATGAQAAAKYINSTGGVNGKAIDIDVCDTKGITNNAINCGNQAVKNGDLAVVGGADPTDAYLTALDKGGIPAIGDYASTIGFTDSLSYPLNAGAIGYVGSMCAILYNKGLRKISFVFNANPGAAAQGQGIAKLLQATMPGLKLKLVGVSPTAVDLSSLVTQAASGEQGIVLPVASTTMSSFLTTAKQLGVHLPIAALGAVLAQGNTLKSLGSLGDGLYVGSETLPSTDTSVPAVKAFSHWMDVTDSHASQDDLSAEAYEAVEIFARLAKGDPGITAAALVSKLNKLTGLDLGLQPPIQFATPVKDVPNLTRLFNPDAVAEQVSNKQLNVLPNSKFFNAFTGA